MPQVYDEDSVHNREIIITLQWYVKRIMQAVSSNATVLELGIGFGESTYLFSEYFSRHVVLDHSPEVIDRFLSKYPQTRAEVIAGSFEEYCPAERFDLIIMGFVLEHVDDPVAVLRRFGAFLAPGGQLFVVVPNARSLHRLIGEAAGMLQNPYALSEYDRRAGHQRYFDLASVTDLIVACGYKVLGLEGVMLKPVTSGQMQTLGFDDAMFEALCKVGAGLPEISNSILVWAEKG